MEGAKHLDGFVFPKFGLDNLADYFDRLVGRPSFQVMPTLETREVFDTLAMCRLRDVILEHSVRDQILALRIGGNDLMRLLGMRRDPEQTVYQTVLGPVISRLVTTFRPYGLPLTAPVYDSFTNSDVLAEEVRADLAHGLTAKTAIHPSQVSVIHGQYAVSSSELMAAEQLLDANRPAVFGLDGVMHERTTHLPWAEGIRERAEHFGVLSSRERSSDQIRIPYVFHG
jgi:citrate lyase beta subunit